MAETAVESLRNGYVKGSGAGTLTDPFIQRMTLADAAGNPVYGIGVVASAGTKNNVASSATSVPIAAANATRKSITIVNDSTAILYLDRTGGTASATSYTDFLAGSTGGVPTSLTVNNFTGAVTGIWASATGAARVSEYT